MLHVVPRPSCLDWIRIAIKSRCYIFLDQENTILSSLCKDNYIIEHKFL